MNIKTIALFGGLAIGLSGCQLTSTADLATDTILTSINVDAMQTDLGEYVNSQTALDEVDNVQVDLLTTLSTGEGAEYILSYQARILVAYTTLRNEALERWGELSQTQQTNLINLDNQLIALNDKFNNVLNSTGFTAEVLDLLYRTTMLITYYKAI